MADSMERRVYRPRVDTLTPVDPELLRKTLEIEASIERIEPGSGLSRAINGGDQDGSSSSEDIVLSDGVLPPGFLSPRVYRVERKPHPTDEAISPSIELVPFVAPTGENPTDIPT